jgi:hypothetical protein
MALDDHQRLQPQVGDRQRRPGQGGPDAAVLVGRRDTQRRQDEDRDALAGAVGDELERADDDVPDDRRAWFRREAGELRDEREVRG